MTPIAAFAAAISIPILASASPLFQPGYSQQSSLTVSGIPGVGSMTLDPEPLDAGDILANYAYGYSSPDDSWSEYFYASTLANHDIDIVGNVPDGKGGTLRVEFVGRDVPSVGITGISLDGVYQGPGEGTFYPGMFNGATVTGPGAGLVPEPGIIGAMALAATALKRRTR